MGEAAHIYSAAPKGPRANPSLSPEERAAASNGIHLCKNHAKFIDVDVEGFPAPKLMELKSAHEQSIRSLFSNEATEFDADFLNEHETQVIHGRGAPRLNDLWIPRHLVQPSTSRTLLKHDPFSLVSSETGILLISGDQSSGRSSLLKRIASHWIDQRHLVWLQGATLTERVMKDPTSLLASGYRKLNSNSDGWNAFLDAPITENLILIDDLHNSPLNLASKRKLLSLLQKFSGLIVVTVNDPFILELVAISPNDGLRLNHFKLLDLTRSDCADIAAKWCAFGAESVQDSDLDARTAATQDQLELVFCRKLMPRHPVYILTALQLIDAATPMESHVGSFGGVYETIIHFAISKHARNQAEIGNERSYLQELAYYCEFHDNSTNRQSFNEWFAEHKAISSKRSAELESSVLAKGFLSKHHQGFRFNYQKHYFLAAFLRDNPNRPGAKTYISKLVHDCWSEDYANTALFLAYLQPSSYLTEALLAEVKRLFVDQSEFEIREWQIPTPYPSGFFRGLPLSTDPESNRRLLAQRLDETAPLSSSECETSAPSTDPADDDRLFLNYIKSFHAIKLIGQLIRNSPIAFDAEQKHDLVKAGFQLSLRLVSFTQSVCNPTSLQSQALNALRDRVLKESDRVQLEAKLAGIIYNLSLFLAFSPLRHACYYLAHPELTLTYKKVLQLDREKSEQASFDMLACGLEFELRTPNSSKLRKLHRELSPAGQDLLRMWTAFFLSFNRVPVSKKQSILESVQMAGNTQLLLPSGSE
jgi:hypothetical protein